MRQYQRRTAPAMRIHLAISVLVISAAVIGCRLVDSAVEMAVSTERSPAQETLPAETPGTSLIPATAEETASVSDSETPLPAGPNAAMLPAAQGDLAALTGIPQYQINLDIAPSLSSFSGNMRLDYVNNENVALDRLYFRLLPNGGKSFGDGTLSVTSAAVDGLPVEYELDQEDKTILELKLPAALPPGEQIRVEMGFSGEVPLDFGGGERPDGYGIYNLTDNVLALSGWYPVLAVYDETGWNLDPTSAIGDSLFSETSLYDVNVCLPEDVEAVATGVVVEQKQRDNDICSRYESGPVRDFFVIAGSEFNHISAEVNGTTVNSYYLPGHGAAAEKALKISADSLRIYNEKFGAYPFVELDVVEAPMRNALGVEFPGIVLIAEPLYDTPDKSSFQDATAHEVAHQWWYSVVGNDIFEEPWLDEGLTTYTSSLYYEDALPPEWLDALWNDWNERYERLKQEGRDDPVAESLAYFEADPEERSYSGVVYIKGALFFRAVRQEIGDEAFFEALAKYYQQYKYGVARGEDLLTVFETAAGRELDDLYQQWLYAPDGPSQ